VLEFRPTRLGEQTAGTFSLFFDGSDVGLSTSGEGIDALAVLPSGDLLISVSNRFSVDGLRADDADLLLFVTSSSGTNTSGQWSLYVDGSTAGFGTEDIWGASWGDMLALTFQNTYNSQHGAVQPWDIMQLGVAATATESLALILDGELRGLRPEALDAIHVVASSP
jgi:hypothetical protein